MSLNQFQQSVIKGMVDQRVAANVITCQYDKAASGDLVPGQLVKLGTAAGESIVVVASAANTDVHFGVVTFNPMKSAIKPGQFMEVASTSSVVYVEAGAALARGAKVAWAANQKVVAAGAGDVVAGTLLDIAAADGSLVRMVVAGPHAPVVPTP